MHTFEEEANELESKKNDLYLDIQGLAKTENEKKLDDLFSKHSLKINSLIGNCQAYITEKEDKEREHLEQKVFEEMIEKKLEEEYNDSLKTGRTNFAYLYEKNKQGILLYPRMKTEVKPWSPEHGWVIDRFPETSGRYLLSHATDPETEARRTLIQESFLKEGEIQRELIPGPFKTPLTFLVISLGFFYKFWANLN